MSFSALWAIGALISFCVFEHLFFLAVKSSGSDLGFFGRFHAFLWTLLQSFGVALSGVIYGLANVTAACQMDQPLDEEEHVEGPADADLPIFNPPIVNPPVKDHPIINCPVGGFPIEASPPPP
jgi:hypothetical protein